MLAKFDCIDDFLGEKSTRFFSNGYKRSIRTISDVRISALGAEAVCCVSVPKDWSIKGKTYQAVHLSSVDALLIALQLSEAYCVILHTLSASMRKAITIVSISMKAGKKPLENLENFKATMTLTSVNNAIFSFIHDVGGMTVELQLRLPFHNKSLAFFPQEGFFYGTISDILGESKNNFYGTGFSDASHEIKNVTVDLSASSVTAIVNSTFSNRILYQGMETTVNVCASPIDAMVILSQLGQCYLYLLDGISRANSSTLWMRAMTFSRVDSFVENTSFASIDVVRSERLLIDEKPWRCVNIKGYMDGMTIFYGLGHALPC